MNLNQIRFYTNFSVYMIMYSCQYMGTCYVAIITQFYNALLYLNGKCNKLYLKLLTSLQLSCMQLRMSLYVALLLWNQKHLYQERRPCSQLQIAIRSSQFLSINQLYALVGCKVFVPVVLNATYIIQLQLHLYSYLLQH